MLQTRESDFSRFWTVREYPSLNNSSETFDDMKSIDEPYTVDDARKSTALKRMTIMTFKPQGSVSQTKFLLQLI